MGSIYPERESKYLEFKATINKFDALIKTCVAFANGIGGKIIVGVADKTREIIGIDDQLRERIYEAFPNSLYDSTQPSLLVDISEKRFNDVSVINIEVPQSIKKPVFIKAEGTLKGVYLRAGASTRRATRDYIEELMRENKRMSYDAEIIQADVGILSKDLLRQTFSNIGNKRLIAEGIIRQSGANHELYHPSISGVLMFCEQPERYIPEAIIQCTRFKGRSGRDIIQTEEIKGNLERQIETSYHLLVSWLERDHRLSGVKLKAKTIIPPEGLREGIINAVMHRKYWIPGSIKIALYDDRLEIFSPGDFPGLIDLKNLGDGTTVLRNPHLANLARRVHLVEKLGTGIRLMQESCAKAGIAKPVFIEGADSVKLIFNFMPSTEPVAKDESKLLALFKMREHVVINDVMQLLKVSRNTATRKLNKLLSQDIIVRIGKGRGVKYFLKS